MPYRLTVDVLANIESEEIAKARCRQLFHPLPILKAEHRDPQYCEILLRDELDADSENAAICALVHFLGHISERWELRVTMDRKQLLSATCRDVDSDGLIHCDVTLIKVNHEDDAE